jgi:hypothetical protein
MLAVYQRRFNRLFLREIEDCIVASQDFAFETTLAGRSYLKLVERLHATGWRVELDYYNNLIIIETLEAQYNDTTKEKFHDTKRDFRAVFGRVYLHSRVCKTKRISQIIQTK